MKVMVGFAFANIFPFLEDLEEFKILADFKTRRTVDKKVSVCRNACLSERLSVRTLVWRKDHEREREREKKQSDNE